MVDFIKRLYIASSGYSYTHLGRMFLRMFVGVVMLQFGVRQIMVFSEIAPVFPTISGIPPQLTLILLIAIEIFCSFCIMIGFCTRLMTMPPFVAMCIAECYIINSSAPIPPYMLGWESPVYLPIMFIGIYFFLLLVGPGKISCDYFLSLHLIHTEDKSEAELEEV